MRAKLPYFRFLCLIPLLFGMGSFCLAGSATWNASPVDNKWTNPANWTPATVPDSATDVATFGTTAITNITVPTDVTVGQIVSSARSPSIQTASMSVILTRSRQPRIRS
ncbi:MAG: hypothetical protein H0X40_01765 [Chthoniobacterales bacterium]|nr:hypothetical protein [Chthoniobacterales bacterium]